ncbi:MAG: two-component sensor histidine kinase, partial [Oscillospiraceae bacterium]|nr:two-component sensor histidine kinase [Oscillospiraceae bacterium]
MLILLNTYPLLVSQDLVFKSKETSLRSSIKLIEASLSGLDELTEENVSAALSSMTETGVNRLLVTDTAGKILYDSRKENGAVGMYAFYSEIAEALWGNDAFYCSYDEQAFFSRMAEPVVYHNEIVGAVYVYEYDTAQAELLKGFQQNL